MKKAWLYITTNLVNGKKYIGQTTSMRPSYVGSGNAIMAAIKKYGKEHFVRENIFEGEWELVDLLEYEFIEKYDAINSPLFYNQKQGGHHGKHNNLETSRKISEARLGSKDSNETKLKKSLAHLGEKNHFFNKSHTEESIKKIKEKRAIQVITEESNRKRSETIKSLPKLQCIKCSGWYYKRNLIQHHNEKCKKVI